jgi:hypothetical protein
MFFAGCACRPADEVSRRAALTQEASVPIMAIVPSTLTFTSGRLPGGQSVAGLAARELNGTSDVWSAYVEFGPKARAVAQYTVPPELLPPASALSLRTNYRGPTKKEMRWTFEAFDFQAGAWTTIGDNAFAGDWTWTAATFALEPRFVSVAGEARVRYGTDSDVDASDMDELVLLASAAPTPATPPPSQPAAAAPPQTDPAPAPPPPIEPAPVMPPPTEPAPAMPPPTEPAPATPPPTEPAPATPPPIEPALPPPPPSGAAAPPPQPTPAVTAPAPVPPLPAPPVPPPTASRWQPRPGTSWQIQLQGALDTSVAASAYDVDLFDTPASAIAALHAGGRKVICYFSAGSFEDWRADAGRFPAATLGNALDGWPGERWLDTRADGVRAVMRARLDLAVQKKCDAVDPDNVDGYTNTPGFPLTSATQVDYNRFLATEGHARGLGVGLKNDLSQVASLVDDFDFAINEQCQVYRECDLLTPFIARSKAVLGIEYAGATSSVCAAANAANFDTNMKKLDLGAWRMPCR